MDNTFPHGGNLRALAGAANRGPGDILDFSANINPLGPPPWLRTELAARAGDLVHYPDPDCAALIKAASGRYETPPETLLAGNGTSELLFALPGAAGPGRALLPAPCYVDYETACARSGLAVSFLPPAREEGLPPDLKRLGQALEEPALVILASPNNPTGTVVPAEALRELAAARPDSLFVVDEAFADFVPNFDSLTRDRPENVVVLLSLTKAFAIPGLRLGLVCASPGVIQRLRRRIPPWSVNTLAQAVGVRALADAAHLDRTRAAVASLRAGLAKALNNIPGLTVTPSRANYLLCRLETGDAEDIARRLLTEHGVAVRACANYQGLDNSRFRVAVRPEPENIRLAAALRRILAPTLPPRPVRRKTPALMVQGTSSNAGKSLLCAALCRILLREGLRVAPFKSQNMSLNSFVDRRGREMGRAQVLQAQACRLAPDARMNPILLKPSSDTGSQVIVMGRPVGNMRVAEYVAYKPRAFDIARKAYDDLAAQADAMVIEGAGSPAEVNLKAHDIVNMAMAEYAGARVLLVADIDRGGAFAALLGTMECLTERERALTAGYVLNRFRGDPSLLDDAFAFMRQATNKEVLGVVPHIDNHGLPEEDSVSFKAGNPAGFPAGFPAHRPSGDGDQADLDIAVVDLDHISNFTDFDAPAAEPDTAVRTVRTARDLEAVPDVLVLPGSKNTLADLEALRAKGLDKAILALARQGVEIVGICAGLQMLGRRIADPHGLESPHRAVDGLGLLPLATELATQKTLARTDARHTTMDAALSGYEIHHGKTETLEGEDCRIEIVRADNTPVGFAARNGRVWGSYLHGLFDADAFRRAWLNRLRRRKGLPPVDRTTPYDLEPALDRLADIVGQSLDMRKIHALLGL